jgi:hypothetical protein
MVHSVHPFHRLKNIMPRRFMLGSQRCSCLPPPGGVINNLAQNLTTACTAVEDT